MLLLSGAFSIGLAQTGYKQWEVMSLTPKKGQDDILQKGLAEHHKVFHASDPYKCWVWEMVSGPNSGSYEWVMGPTTWTQMDGRPEGGAHDADWAKNVDPYIEKYGEVAYWRSDNDLVYEPANSNTFGISRFRYTTLIPGGYDRFETAVAKVVDVYKAKNYGAAFRVYWKYGFDDGPHVMTEMNFSNWAYLDTDVDFPKDFTEVHGEGSWERFLEEIALCVDRAKTYDVLAEFLPDASSK